MSAAPRDQQPRRILVVSHFAREEAIDASITVLRLLGERGIVPVIESSIDDELRDQLGDRLPACVERLGVDCAIADCELVMVLGGDGTILRGVEIARPGDVPVLGVNLGHVGFLAESERDSLPYVLERVIERDYDVERRLALDLTVEAEDGTRTTGWALNEASVEKGNRERMLDVVIDVDGEPLSSFGCDGVLLSTPTGSTAYSFSAGGPVVAPGLDAIVLTPICPHSMGVRAMVLPPTAVVELRAAAGADSQVVIDGQRVRAVEANRSVRIGRSERVARFIRLNERDFFQTLKGKLTDWNT